MPIKWSAMRVMEAADILEKHINAAIEPLDCAKEVANAALEIPNIPGYVDQHFHGVLWNIDNAVRRLRDNLQLIRNSVPKDALEAEKKTSSYGDKVSLV
jgi:hypothetical protein